MNLWAAAVAVLATITLVRALLNGSASIAGQSMLRREEPTVYWFVVACNLAVVIVLLWVGLK